MKVKTFAAFAVIAAWTAVGLYFLAFYLVPMVVPPVFNWFFDPSLSRTITAGCIAVAGVIGATFWAVDEILDWDEKKFMLEHNGQSRKDANSEAKRQQRMSNYGY